MRTASLVGAAAYVRARLTAGSSEGPSNRSVVDAVLQRADEPGELLAHWIATYGRQVPQPVKRGVADAVRRLYTSRSLLKYDTASHGFRFGDVLNLVHASPDPAKPWQGALFRYALDRRRRHHSDRATAPAADRPLTAHRALLDTPVDERRALITGPGGPERLTGAGMTWESVAGWLHGPMDAAVWEALIPAMGPMALLRNLRNFDPAGLTDEAAERVAARLADPQEVARARQFPFRYLAAHQHAAPRWKPPSATAWPTCPCCPGAPWSWWTGPTRCSGTPTPSAPGSTGPTRQPCSAPRSPCAPSRRTWWSSAGAARRSRTRPANRSSAC